MKKTMMVLLLAGILGGITTASASDKCATHYAVVESGSDLDGFLDGFDAKFGGGEAEDFDRSQIAAAYGCQFKGNFPPDSACPAGTTLTRGTDFRYLCHSNSPIPEASRTCLDGFSKIQDYEHKEAPTSKIGRYGFFCNATDDDGQDGFNEKVCSDSGASPLSTLVNYAPGTAYPMLGCIYSK